MSERATHHLLLLSACIPEHPGNIIDGDFGSTSVASSPPFSAGIAATSGGACTLHSSASGHAAARADAGATGGSCVGQPIGSLQAAGRMCIKVMPAGQINMLGPSSVPYNPGSIHAASVQPT